jgi:surfactin synthase thioesterase subunit
MIYFLIYIDIHHTKSDEDFMQHIIECGGLPNNIHPDFLRRSLPLIRRDYKAFETYRFNEDDGLQMTKYSPIHVHMKLIYCPKDICIPDDSAITMWQELIAEDGSCEYIPILSGENHFSLVFDEVTRSALLEELHFL